MTDQRTVTALNLIDVYMKSPLDVGKARQANAALAVIRDTLTQQAATIERLRGLLQATHDRLRTYYVTDENGDDDPRFVALWENDPDTQAIVAALRQEG